MIDYVDYPDSAATGPFGEQTPAYPYDFGSQINDDPTFINREIVKQLVLEVSLDIFGAGNEIDIDID